MARVELAPAVKRARQSRRDLGVMRIECDDLLGGEGIAAAIGGIEAHVIALTEGADQGAQLVWIACVEGGVGE